MPTATAEDMERSFATHANYVNAFTQLMGFTHWEAGDDAVLALRGGIDAFLGAQPPSRSAKECRDLSQVERSLRAAWGTELLLAQQLSVVDAAPEMARISGPWAAVQTYYVGYHATQAMIVASNATRPEDHQRTQSQYTTMWGSRARSFEPWTMHHTHEGLAKCTLPIFEDVSNLQRPNGLNSASLAAKALRTTWANALVDRLQELRTKKHTERRKAWLAEENERLTAGRKPRKKPDWWERRRNLTPDEVAAAKAQVRPQSLLHYLYRLRINANYIDTDVFSEGPASEWDAERFMRDLAFMASALATVHEQRVRHLIGTVAFREIHTRWRTGPGSSFGQAGSAAPGRT